MEQDVAFFGSALNTILEWKINDTQQASDTEDVLVYRDDELEKAKKEELWNWIENKLYGQVPDNS